MGTTFNPSDINANIALSGGNLVATGLNSSHGGARGTGPTKSSGKWMLTFTNVEFGTADNLDYVGLGTLTDTLGLAQGTQDQVIICQSGTSFSGTGSSVLTYTNFPAITGSGHTIDLCVDLTNALFWFRVNGGNWNNSSSANPATGTGGNAIAANGAKVPYVRMTNTAATVTLNPTPASPPSGFATWDVPSTTTSQGHIVG